MEIGCTSFLCCRLQHEMADPVWRTVIYGGRHIESTSLNVEDQALDLFGNQ